MEGSFGRLKDEFSPSRLVDPLDPRVLPHIRRASVILQRDAAPGETGLDESDAAPKKPGSSYIVGPKKRPRPLTAYYRDINQHCGYILGCIAHKHQIPLMPRLRPLHFELKRLPERIDNGLELF